MATEEKKEKEKEEEKRDVLDGRSTIGMSTILSNFYDIGNAMLNASLDASLAEYESTHRYWTEKGLIISRDFKETYNPTQSLQTVRTSDPKCKIAADIIHRNGHVGPIKKYPNTFSVFAYVNRTLSFIPNDTVILRDEQLDDSQTDRPFLSEKSKIIVYLTDKEGVKNGGSVDVLAELFLLGATQTTANYYLTIIGNKKIDDDIAESIKFLITTQVIPHMGNLRYKVGQKNPIVVKETKILGPVDNIANLLHAFQLASTATMLLEDIMNTKEYKCMIEVAERLKKERIDAAYEAISIGMSSIGLMALTNIAGSSSWNDKTYEKFLRSSSPSVEESVDRVARSQEFLQKVLQEYNLIRPTPKKPEEKPKTEKPKPEETPKSEKQKKTEKTETQTKNVSSRDKGKPVQDEKDIISAMQSILFS